MNQFLINQRYNLQHRIPGIDYLWFFYLPIYWFIWIPFEALAIALYAIMETDNIDSPSYVPTFYAPTPSGNSGTLLLIVLILTSTIFGVLHCMGWDFHFPSHAEQLLWHIGSLAITLLSTILFTILALSYIHHVIEDRYRISILNTMPSAMQDIILGISAFFRGASLIAYMAARVLLLTLAVVLLRKQPESAFYAINWANFLPHI